MFPQNSRLAPLIKGLSSFTGRIQAMYLGQVTIIHQSEIKEKKPFGQDTPNSNHLSGCDVVVRLSLFTPIVPMISP
jgi:hypothetical protein